jgi:hypothetical protein
MYMYVDEMIVVEAYLVAPWKLACRVSCDLGD